VLSNATEQLDNLTATEIIQRMQETYATSRSYSDSGVVKTVFIHPDRKRTVEKPFTTAFIRPDQFRFEYREKKPIFGERRFIIFRNGKDFQTYSDLELPMQFESLDRAVAAATGISGGSAIRVPAMLLPSEIKWRRAIRFNNPKRIDDDRIAKIDCFRIHDFILGGPTILWIDKEKFLLRKVYREQEFDDFRAQTTTIYKPQLNQEVTDEMLDFNPP
jgi:outer membrane lipoprotein-sorting protein